MSGVTKNLCDSTIIEHLSYCKESGILFWKTPKRGRKLYKPINTKDKCGYVVIRFNNKLYKAHRVIWFIMTGLWPNHNIDHINGNTSDNRFINLRDLPQLLNSRNSRVRVDNKTGYSGVSFDKVKGRFVVRVTDIFGKYKHLGYFDTMESALPVRESFLINNNYSERHGV